MAKGSSSGNSSASKSLMWMMLAVFAGLAAMLGGALYVASRALHSMGLSAAAGAQDSIRTPNGTLRVQKPTDIGPGLPIYPRASLLVPDDRAAVAEAKKAQSGIETSTYHTSDTRDFVDGWYAKHLSPEFTRHDPGDKSEAAIYSDLHISEDDVAFVAAREETVRVVTLASDSGGTTIALVRYSKQSPVNAPSPAAPSSADQSQTPAQ